MRLAADDEVEFFILISSIYSLSIIKCWLSFEALETLLLVSKVKEFGIPTIESLLAVDEFRERFDFLVALRVRDAFCLLDERLGSS